MSMRHRTSSAQTTRVKSDVGYEYLIGPLSDESCWKDPDCYSELMTVVDQRYMLAG